MQWHVLATMSITMSSGLIAKVFEASQNSDSDEEKDTEEGEALSFAQRALYSISFAVAMLSLRHISVLHERNSHDSCQVSVFGIPLDTILIYFFAMAICLMMTVEAASDPLVYQCGLVFLFLCGATSGFLVQIICGGGHSAVEQHGDFERNFAAVAGNNRAEPTETSKLITSTTIGANC
jgi:uncharacterized membrane protein